MSDIVVDTYKLKEYAQRLENVNGRIVRLDLRMDTLYTRVGLLGLWNLIQADALTGYSWRLKRCQGYLNQTVVEFESVEKHLCSGEPTNSSNWEKGIDVFSAVKNVIVDVSTGGSASKLAGDLQSVSDVMQWIDKNYSNLPDSIQALLKDACKKLFKNGVPAYEIVQMMLEGDFWGVIWKATGTVAPSTFDWKNGGAINWLGLKIKAVSIVGNLVTDSEGYIQANDKKYQKMMEESLKEGDLFGFIWNGVGSFVQTVGKGTVDAACQLISGAFDSVTENITEKIFGYGVSWSTFNAVMYDVCGWSPGHAFNVVGGIISDGVDTFIDGGAKFWSAFSEQTYSDFKEFGDLIGDAASATADFIGDAASAVGGWFKSWF